MLPFSYAEKVKELAHLGGVDDYKLLTCKIGDLWRFVVVDQCYKNMSAGAKIVEKISNGRGRPANVYSL